MDSEVTDKPRLEKVSVDQESVQPVRAAAGLDLRLSLVTLESNSVRIAEGRVTLYLAEETGKIGCSDDSVKNIYG